MIVPAPISSSIVALTPPFDVHLDSADMVFMKKKLVKCNERQKNALLSEAQVDPYSKIVAVLEQTLRRLCNSASQAPPNSVAGGSRMTNDKAKE